LGQTLCNGMRRLVACQSCSQIALGLP
jgi:hypothetical protein